MRLKKDTFVDLTPEKLVFGGQSLAKKDGRLYFVWNALPGEAVKAKVVNKKKWYF